MLSDYLFTQKPGRKEIQVGKTLGGKAGVRVGWETEDTTQNSPSACWHQPCDMLESYTSTCSPLEKEQVYQVCNISCTDLLCFYVAPATWIKTHFQLILYQGMDWFQYWGIMLFICMYIYNQGLLLLFLNCNTSTNEIRKAYLPNCTLNLIYCSQLLQKHSLDIKRQRSKLC